MQDVPFEQTESGNYRILPPSDGMEPDQIDVTVDGTVYRLSGYVGKDASSNILPDVLVYEFCTTEEVV